MPIIRYLFSITFVLGGFCFLPGAAQAGETNHTCTGFIDSVPAIITTQGVWCMRQDLSTANTGGNAIAINVNNVTIDCNNFKLGGLAAGSASRTMGIRATNRQNATVRNCNIRGFFTGVMLTGGAGHLVEDNHFDNNNYAGIRVSGTNSMVRRNRVFDTGGAPAHNGYAYGITVSGYAIDNVISGVTGGWGEANAGPTGISAASKGTVIRGNRISGVEVTGPGFARGIDVSAYGTTSQVILDDNHITAYGSPRGSGVDAGIGTACINNVVMGFQTAYSGCAVAVNNH